MPLVSAGLDFYSPFRYLKLNHHTCTPPQDSKPITTPGNSYECWKNGNFFLKAGFIGQPNWPITVKKKFVTNKCSTSAPLGTPWKQQHRRNVRT